LTGRAADWLPLVEPDDAINVIGRVERLADGTLAVIVEDPEGIVLGSDPSDPDPDASASTGTPGPDQTVGLHPPLAADLTGDLLGGPGAGAGLASLLGISLASVAATMLRRRRARRLLTARVTQRLAALGHPPRPDAD
jgi:hypothetical protein